jgi:hypothetical protein
MPETVRDRNPPAGRFLMRYGIEGSFGAVRQKLSKAERETVIVMKCILRLALG